MYPLSPAHDAVLNRSPSPRRYDDDYEVRKYTVTSTSEDGDTMSSPLISNTSAVTTATTRSQQENGFPRPGGKMGGPALSPAKDRRHSRVMSGTELSPLKILSRKRSSEEACQTDGSSMGPPPARSARKISSPEKRFPVKIGGVGADEIRDRQASMDEAMRTNGHLQRAIDIFEDEEEEEEEQMASRPATAASNHDGDGGDGGFNPDDTMTSTFSTFSAAQTLSSYANWRAQQSPAKLAALASVSSRPSTRDESGNTTNLLMDFTDSLRHPRRSPDKKLLPSSNTLPNLSMATPSRSGATTTLIDFDIPPLPTPRSVPSISSRELESLKSGFLSEISSLRASLSGKEAEVHSLKTAVGDAEKRVGESMEKLREEAALREQAAAERDDWERRGREMETVLHKLQDEVVHGQQDREEAERRLDESEKRREAAEILHQEAESKIAGLRAGKESESDPSRKSSPQQTAREVEAAVERVARELHGLYKVKHQTKVTALKKSYEVRWDKKFKDLERRMRDLVEENATLKAGASAVDPDDTLLVAAQAHAEADRAQASRDRVAIRELHATVQRLEAEVSSVQGDNQQLRGLREHERVEKGELVQLAEEMMAMQQQQQPQQQSKAKTPARALPAMPEPAGAKTPGKRPLSLQTTTPGRQMAGGEGRRGSVGKASGLRAPGSAYRGGAAAAAASGMGGLRIPASRSGILSSIEKMGSHRGRGQ